MIVLLFIVNLAGLLAVMWHATRYAMAIEDALEQISSRIDRLELKRERARVQSEK